MIKVVSEDDLLHLQIVCPTFLSHLTDTYLFSHSPSFSVLVIAAAGNSGQDSWGYPASYPTVMSVGSVTSSGSLSSFSTRNDQVEITGPGSSVKSTVPNNQYEFLSGTSMVRLLSIFNCWAYLFVFFTKFYSTSVHRLALTWLELQLSFGHTSLIVPTIKFVMR